MMLKWNKPDLQPPNYVLYFRQDRFYDDFQHEFFKGRVTLKDPEWKKTGNLSVILKNVTMNDTGTYECHAGYNDDVKLLSTVNLSVVDPPGQTGGHTEDGGKEDRSVGLKVGLSVPAVLVIVGVGAVFIYRTYRRRQNQDYQPPEDQGL
ncbi:unnamed protein product [Oreochromis niloticus]|nr:unnamed protein product [Mustela putorius furo]